MKRSSELFENLQNRKRLLNAEINYLVAYKDHFSKYDGKVFNKNVTSYNDNKISLYCYFKSYYIELYGYSKTNEGYKSWDVPELKNAMLIIEKKDALYVPEGKSKECLNAAAINTKIDELIEAKKGEIETISRINQNEIKNILNEYNKAVEALNNIYTKNEYIIKNAGAGENIRKLEKAAIDVEGYKPLKGDRVYEIIEEEKQNSFTKRSELKKNAIKILKESSGWLENNTLKLINTYGCGIVGDDNYLTIYPYCEDEHSTIPCVNISIKRGCLC